MAGNGSNSKCIIDRERERKKWLEKVDTECEREERDLRLS